MTNRNDLEFFFGKGRISKLTNSQVKTLCEKWDSGRDGVYDCRNALTTMERIEEESSRPVEIFFGIDWSSRENCHPIVITKELYAHVDKQIMENLCVKKEVL